MQEGENSRGNSLGDVGDISSFIAAAHELKSPLALIRQLALSFDQADVSDKGRIIEQIQLTAERSLRLTSDITRSIRLEDSLFELEPINPIALCNEVASELQPLFRAKGRKLSVKGRKKPLLMVANKELLRRIIANFSDNALHYSNELGVVEISTSASNSGKIRISVRDYGPAMSLKDWRSLKGRLGGLQSIHSRPESSGLGLQLAAQFADAMNSNLGIIRHRDGVSFYVEGNASEQLSLV